MAAVTRTLDATPGQVWAVLADGWLYGGWVVGTSHMRAVELSWPGVGAKLFHASGLWPLVARDETEVHTSVPGQRLVLAARGGPFGQARVTIELTPAGAGTSVALEEVPIAGPVRWLNNPVLEAALARRNIEALARLEVLAVRPAQPQD